MRLLQAPHEDESKVHLKGNEPCQNGALPNGISNNVQEPNRPTTGAIAIVNLRLPQRLVNQLPEMIVSSFLTYV